MVYHELWLDTQQVMIPIHGSLWAHLSYGDTRTDQMNYFYEFPTWLLTNKAILNEGILQLLTKAVWSWERGGIPLYRHSQTSPLVLHHSDATKFQLENPRISTHPKSKTTALSGLWTLPSLRHSLGSQLRVLNFQTDFVLPVHERGFDAYDVDKFLRHGIPQVMYFELCWCLRVRDPYFLC